MMPRMPVRKMSRGLLTFLVNGKLVYANDLAATIEAALAGNKLRLIEKQSWRAGASFLFPTLGSR